MNPSAQSVASEVARADASASLIPAVNKLGTMGLILRGSDDLKKKVLPDIANGKMASYALSEREAGSDAAAMRTRAKADGDDWILNGSKCWITNGGQSSWYTVMAVTDPDQGANGISAFMVHKDDPGFTVGPLEHKLGIKGRPTAELYFENCTIPDDRIIGDEGTGFKTALATLDHTRPTIGAQAVGIAQGALDGALAYVKERSQFGKKIAASEKEAFVELARKDRPLFDKMVAQRSDMMLTTPKLPEAPAPLEKTVSGADDLSDIVTKALA